MFTFKFVRKSGDYESICGSRYAVVRPRAAGTDATTDVWIYPTHRPENPIRLHLGRVEDETTFLELFVENQSGKTIDRMIGAMPFKEEMSSQ